MHYHFQRRQKNLTLKRLRLELRKKYLQPFVETETFVKHFGCSNLSNGYERQDNNKFSPRQTSRHHSKRRNEKILGQREIRFFAKRQNVNCHLRATPLRQTKPTETA